MVKNIELTQGYFAIVDDDYDELSNFKWCAEVKIRHGKLFVTAVRSQKKFEYKDNKRVIVRMHRIIMNCPDDMVVDHINHNTLDNRKCNLRVVSHDDNCKNRELQSNNVSGYVGVNWHKRIKSWRAFIGRSGDTSYKYIGTFKNKIDAALAYDEIAESRGYIAFNFKHYINSKIDAKFSLDNYILREVLI